MYSLVSIVSPGSFLYGHNSFPHAPIDLLDLMNRDDTPYSCWKARPLTFWIFEWYSPARASQEYPRHVQWRQGLGIWLAVIVCCKRYPGRPLKNDNTTSIITWSQYRCALRIKTKYIPQHTIAAITVMFYDVIGLKHFPNTVSAFCKMEAEARFVRKQDLPPFCLTPSLMDTRVLVSCSQMRRGVSGMTLRGASIT